MPEVVAELDRICLSRGGRRILSDVNVQIGPGVTVVLGPNGSGKTTLLRAVATLDRPESGDLFILETEVGRRTLAGIRRNIGYMAQAPEILPRMTVQQNLWYVGWLNRMAAEERAGRISQLVHALQLTELLEIQARKLSDGTLQRLGVAMAALTSPTLLILDEPTAGVDTEHRARFRGFIRDMGTNSAVVVASHLHEDVIGLADYVIVLGHGRVLFDGTAPALLDLAPAASSNELPTEAAVRWLLER